MIEWIVATLRSNPELAIFLTLGLGYWIGERRFGSFSLGAVTGVLLAGILVGQLDIAISSQVKSVFFIMFLFAVGCGVGPQFVKGLAPDGLPQALKTDTTHLDTMQSPNHGLAGAKGIVVAGVGDGNMTAPALDALATLAQKGGVVVVRASRVGHGIVKRNVEVDDDKLGFVAARELNPQRVRILLQLGLLETSNPREIQRMLDKY